MTGVAKTGKYKFWEFVSQNERLAQNHTLKELGRALCGNEDIILVGRALYTTEWVFKKLLEKVVPSFVVIHKAGGYRYEIENARVQLMSWEGPVESLYGRAAVIFDIEELEDEARGEDAGKRLTGNAETLEGE